MTSFFLILKFSLFLREFKQFNKFLQALLLLDLRQCFLLQIEKIVIVLDFFNVGNQ